MPKPKKSEAREAVLRHDRDGFVRCRICGCTEREPCEPPCAWAKGEADLCSNCAGLVLCIVGWLTGARGPSWAALRREVRAVVEGATEQFKRKGANL